MSSALRSSGRLASLALAWAVVGAAAAEEAAQKIAPEFTPAQWLERMDHALTTRNYDGTFSHWQGGRMELLRIIHRVQDGTVSERLASLDGSGREFIRTGSSLSCYLPDRRTVLVEQRPAEESLVSFPTVNDQTASFYDIREAGHTRLNRRDTHVITVSPKDEYRYGYRLWIDASTAPHAQPGVAALAWNAMSLPPGFRMTVRSAQVLPGSASPVDHLVFTDGFASVSVFVERQPAPTGEQPVPESATVGSSSAFSTVVDGHKITAVGEVPPATVRFIASQLKAQGAPSAGR